MIAGHDSYTQRHWGRACLIRTQDSLDGNHATDLVGDRGLLTDARIRDEVKPAGLDWITALRAPAIRALVDNGDVQPSLFDERDLAEITSPELFGDERLVVCRNPLFAARRAHKRRELLAATEVELEKVVAATRRDRRPLRGKDTIAVRADRALRRYKVGKHFIVVCRGKAPFLSGCETRPATVVPAGSNRSGSWR